MAYNVWFAILHLAFLFMLIFFVHDLYSIFINGNKTYINYSFLSITFFTSVWCLGQMLEVYIRCFYGYTNMEIVYIYLTGMVLVSPSILLMCYSYVNPNAKFKLKWLIFLIPSAFSLFLIWSNNSFHLFLIKYAPMNKDMIVGKLFVFHSISTIGISLVSIIILLIYQSRSSNLIKKQMLLSFFGVLFPIVVNVLLVLKLIKDIPTFFTALVAIVPSITWYIAIFKYGMLNTIPITLREINNYITAGIMVVYKNGVIGERNKRFDEIFAGMISIKDKVSLKDIIQNITNEKVKKLFTLFLKSAEEGSTIKNLFENLEVNNINNCYEIDSRPIPGKKSNLIIMTDETKIYFKSIEAHLKAIDMKSPYTAGHNSRVATYSAIIAQMMGYKMADVIKIWQAAMMHDIGKLGIRDEILNSNIVYAWNSDEMKLLRTHPEMGVNLLKSMGIFDDLLDIILYHHERVDGKGYYEKKREKIPHPSLIIACADTIDALTSGRPYQETPVRSVCEALNILISYKIPREKEIEEVTQEVIKIKDGEEVTFIKHTKEGITEKIIGTNNGEEINIIKKVIKKERRNRPEFISPGEFEKRIKENPNMKYLKPDIGTQLDEECFNTMAEMFMDAGFIKRQKSEVGLFVSETPEKILNFTKKNEEGKIILIPRYTTDLSISVDRLYKVLQNRIF